MRAVVLSSGGLDSTLLAHLAREEGCDVYPLFVDYGQIAGAIERAHCFAAMKRLGFREPKVADLHGYGALIRSGLTDPGLDIVKDAFTPGRNSLFLLSAASYAATIDASTIMLGLLDEEFHLFSDQTHAFLRDAERFLEHAVGRPMSIRAPLMAFSKSQVVAMAESCEIGATYSCHAGAPEPCGVCIACLEYSTEEH